MQLAKISKICKVWYAKYSKNCKVEDANLLKNLSLNEKFQLLVLTIPLP